jgi:hypothetical protein
MPHLERARHVDFPAGPTLLTPASGLGVGWWPKHQAIPPSTRTLLHAVKTTHRSKRVNRNGLCAAL